MRVHDSTERQALLLRQLEESLLQPDVRKSRTLVDLLADEFIAFGIGAQSPNGYALNTGLRA